MSEKTQLLPRWQHQNHLDTQRISNLRQYTRYALIWGTAILLFLHYGRAPRSWSDINPRLPLKDIPASLETFQHCSIRNIFKDTDLGFLSTAHPLNVSEFVTRRDRLAQALAAEGVDAFAVEPGYTFQYYANVSQ